MKIKLNEDKSSMCGIGKKVFLNFENPGPIELDPKTLDRQELGQLVMLIRMQHVLVSDVDELNSILEGLQKSAPQPATAKPTPVTAPAREVTIEDLQEQDTAALKKILAGSMASVKKDIAALPPSKIRKLLELERQGTARKGIINLATELLAKHQEAVTAKVGTEDIGTATDASKAEIGKGMRGVILDNISDIVESEVTPVTLK